MIKESARASSAITLEDLKAGKKSQDYRPEDGNLSITDIFFLSPS